MLIFLAFFIFTGAVSAANIAGQSAVVSYNLTQVPRQAIYFRKKLAIKKVLEKYHSPIQGSIDDFMASCTTYELDCYLLPSITGLESSFGRFTYPNSNNGFGWGGGYIMFSSWSEAISTVAKSLRQNYIDKGADTVDKIGPIYAESLTWSQRVNSFMNEFRQEEQNLNLYLKPNQVEL